ncbi:hypothetical protein PSAB6_620030 [Paraburkholderia sabiae]|nr:hypothetical protein PSAB6_620030 [Paraburkholderia sabiae]
MQRNNLKRTCKNPLTNIVFGILYITRRTQHPAKEETSWQMYLRSDRKNPLKRTHNN